MKLNNHLLWAMSVSVSLVACAEDVDQTINEHEVPGVQEPGHSEAVHRGCSTIQPSATEMAAMELSLAAQRTDDIASLTASRVIPVHFHIIHRSNGSGGVVTTQMI